MQRYTYKVVEVREKLVGGKMSGGKLEKLLNDHAEDGCAHLREHRHAATDAKRRANVGGDLASYARSAA